MKKDISLIKFPLEGKYLLMVAPSFVVDFDYPFFISKAKLLGFDKVVEVTFGAKMVNREYHEILKNSNELQISSTCPGIVDYIFRAYPKYANSLIKVDSPMIAMGKICKKVYPNHKVVFLSPCNFKKIEASKSKYVDYVIDFKELKTLFLEKKIKSRKKDSFDKFYNDYTKVYPLSGGLTKTANLKKVIKKNEVKVVDGIIGVKSFLENPSKKIRFLDCTSCEGGCIGGPLVNSKESISKRKERVLDYFERSLREDIPDNKKGLVSCAEGIIFLKSFS